MGWIKSSRLFIKFLALISCVVQCCCHEQMEDYNNFVTVLSLEYRDKLLKFDEKNFDSFIFCICNSPLFLCEASFTRYKNEYHASSTPLKYLNATTPALPKSKMLCSIDQRSDYTVRLLCTPSGENNCKRKLEVTSPTLLGNRCMSLCLDVGWHEDSPIVFGFVNASFAILKSCDTACEIRHVTFGRDGCTSQTTTNDSMSTNGATVENFDSNNDSETITKKDFTDKTTQEFDSAMLTKGDVVKFNYTFISVSALLLVIGTVLAVVLNARLKKLLASKHKEPNEGEFSNGLQIRA